MSKFVTTIEQHLKAHAKHLKALSQPPQGKFVTTLEQHEHAREKAEPKQAAMDPNWLNKWIELNGPYLYHGTGSPEATQAIQQHGLYPHDEPLPGDTQEAWVERERQQNAPAPGEIREYGDGWEEPVPSRSEWANQYLRPRQNAVYMGTGRKAAGYVQPGGDLLKIDLRKLNPNNLVADEDAYLPNSPEPNNFDHPHTKVREYDPPPLSDDYFGDQGMGLGEWADNINLGDNPAETHHSLSHHGAIAHQGIVPPEAISKADHYQPGLMNQPFKVPYNYPEQPLDEQELMWHQHEHNVQPWGEPHASAVRDELHISMDIPRAVGKKIHDWVRSQNWPEGTELEHPKDYHITLLYSPQDHDRHREFWVKHLEDAHAKISGFEDFGGGTQSGDHAYVLRIESPEIEEHANSLQDTAERRGLEINRFEGGYKPHITIAYSPYGAPAGLQPPPFEFDLGPSTVSPRRPVKEAAQPQQFVDAIHDLSMRSVAHNLHYKFEQDPTTDMNSYAGQLLKMMGYPQDDMTNRAAIDTWLALYPNDRQLHLDQPNLIEQATTPTESWGYGTVSSAPNEWTALYHGTHSGVPAETGGLGYSERNNGPFLTDSLDAAHDYATDIAKRRGTEPRVYQVTPPDPSLMYDDSYHNDTMPGNGWEYDGEIPPENLRRVASEAPEPPNLRDATGEKHKCGNCKMFDKGVCWGYGNKKVGYDDVCDSWAADKTSKVAEQRGWTDFYHVTPRANRESIQNYGLMGENGESPWGDPWKRNQPQGNYFFTNPEDAQSYVDALHSRMGEEHSEEDQYEYPNPPAEFDSWPMEKQNDWYDENSEPTENTDDPGGYDIWKVNTRGLPIHRDPETSLIYDKENPQTIRDRYKEVQKDHGVDDWYHIMNEDMGEHDGGPTPARYYTPENVEPARLQLHQHWPRWDKDWPGWEDDEDWSNAIPANWDAAMLRRPQFPAHSKVSWGNFKPLTEIADRHPQVSWNPNEAPTHIDFGSIKVAPENQRQGLATNALNDLHSYADQVGKPIVITPSSDFGNSKAQLTRWYKSLGYQPRKGEYELPMGTMIRYPKTAGKWDMETIPPAQAPAPGWSSPAAYQPYDGSQTALNHTGQHPLDNQVGQHLEQYPLTPIKRGEGSGINTTYIHETPQGREYVKPQSKYHENDLAHERAASLVGQSMGANVAHAVTRTMPDGHLATVTPSVGSGVPGRFVDPDWFMQYPEDMRRIALFDTAIGNQDRHPNQFAIQNGQLYGFDHGAAFPEDDFGHNGMTYRWAGEPLTEDETSALQRASQHNLEDYGVSPEANKAFQYRVNHMLDTGRFLE